MDPSEDNCLSLRGPEGEKDPWGLEQGEVGRPRARPVWWSWGEGVGRELEATGQGDRCGEGPIRSPKREGRLAPLVLRWRGRTALLQAPALSAQSRETGARGGGGEPRLARLPGGAHAGPAAS